MSSLRRDIKAIFFIGVCSNPIDVSFACDHKHEFALRVIRRKLILIHMNVQLFNKKPVQDLHGVVSLLSAYISVHQKVSVPPERRS